MVVAIPMAAANRTTRASRATGPINGSSDAARRSTSIARSSRRQPDCRAGDRENETLGQQLANDRRPSTRRARNERRSRVRARRAVGEHQACDVAAGGQQHQRDGAEQQPQRSAARRRPARPSAARATPPHPLSVSGYCSPSVACTAARSACACSIVDARLQPSDRGEEPRAPLRSSSAGCICAGTQTSVVADRIAERRRHHADDRAAGAVQHAASGRRPPDRR